MKDIPAESSNIIMIPSSSDIMSMNQKLSRRKPTNTSTVARLLIITIFLLSLMKFSGSTSWTGWSGC